MQKESIDELLKYGERLTVECKKAEGGLPKSVWETYSSFANTNGGTILFGIEEDLSAETIEERFSVGNIKNPEKIIKDFWSVINDKKVSRNILVDSDVTEETYQGKTIIRIHVPQASYKDKPVYINENPLKGSYKRNHEGDYHCTEEEVKTMMRDAVDSGTDGNLLDGYTMEDIDADTLKAYRIEFQLKNPEHIWNSLDNKTFLKNLGGYIKNRKTGDEGLTTAGLLMFGKGLSVQEAFDNIRMDYIDESHLLPESRWSDRLTYDGMWENNLYNFMKRVLSKLVSNLKKPFQLEGMSRIDDTIIHKAVREALVNLIIHSDYHITGILKVVKKDDGFLFSNPGNLKLPIESIYEGGHSKARNPKIQTMFRMIGMGDNIGSGFPTILNAWDTEKWRKPDLKENEDLHTVELRLWMVSLMPKECTEYLKKCMGRNYERLSSNEQIILCTACLEKDITNVRIQALLGLHATDIGKMLYHLTENKMLLKELRGRWTTYRLNKDYEIQADQISIDELDERETLNLNETDQFIYKYICANGFITTDQIIDLTRITTRQGASCSLNRLIQKNLVKKERQGRYFIYTKL